MTKAFMIMDYSVYMCSCLLGWMHIVFFSRKMANRLKQYLPGFFSSATENYAAGLDPLRLHAIL